MKDLDPGCLLILLIALAVGGAIAYDYGNPVTGIVAIACAVFIAIVLFSQHRNDAGRRRIASPDPPTSKPPPEVRRPTPPPTPRRDS